MDEAEAQKHQIAAHIADYQAMMTRMSWFMNLQYLSGAFCIAFLTLAVSLRNSIDSPILFAWGVLAVSQVAVLIYYFALYEVYNHTRYIHTKLKPRLGHLLQLRTDLFWGYEAHLKKFGKAYNPGVGDLLSAVVATIALAVVAVLRVKSSWSRWDSVGCTINALLWFLTARSGLRILKVRGDFESRVTTISGA